MGGAYEHVFRHPALVLRYPARDAQREAFLAQQRVAPVSGPERHYQSLVWHMRYQRFLRVARPMVDHLTGLRSIYNSSGY